jgi:MFS family permease
VKERPEDLGQVPDGAEEANSVRASGADSDGGSLITAYDWTPAEAYRTRAYWLIAVAGIMSQYPLFFFVAHWLLHARGAGIPAAAAAWTMSAFAIGGIVGRLIGGWLMDTIPGRIAFIVGLAIFIVASFLALAVSAETMVVAFAAASLYGVAFGWSFTCMNTCTAHFFGSRAFPKLNGTMIFLTSVIASPASAIGGKIFDVSGGYARAFELNAGLAALGIVAMLFAGMPQAPRELLAE